MSEIAIKFSKGNRLVESFDVPNSGGLIAVTHCTYYEDHFAITHVATGMAFPASFKSKAAAMRSAVKLLKAYPPENLAAKTAKAVSGKLSWGVIATSIGIKPGRRQQ